MATAAVPTGSTGSTAPSRNVSDEEKRWVVIGICLHKILTPALRQILSNEIPKWHQTLVKPPIEIGKQTFAKNVKTLPPSTIKLNYVSINNNTVHKSSKMYDYAVKDPLSLAKLFLKPSMAKFKGFDHNMDTSAVLSVMCEAQPFIACGADVLAKKVRSDVRNEWAHCDFSRWTEANFQTAMKDMESLVKTAGFTVEEQKRVLHDLKLWGKNGKELCLGKPLDEELLKLIQTEVSQLEDAYKKLNHDVDNTKCVLERLAIVSSTLQGEVDKLKESQNELHKKCNSNTRDIEALRGERFSKTDKEDVYVFHAPDTFSWFTGRTRQVEEIELILEKKEQLMRSSARKVAICGLGGSGKTSLAVEYAHRMKDHYQGGVFWFSGEDEKKLENSVNNLALSIGTFVSNSFDVTLSQTLARMSRIQKPWLLIVDDMDELQLSPNVRMLLSGSWQKKCNGHIIVTTRRKADTFVNDVQVQQMKENCCLELDCFDVDDAKDFLFCRTGVPRNEDTETAACELFEELGGLPLALEQAAAYIKSLGCSFSCYLETYKTKRIALLDQQRINPVSEYSSQRRLAVKTTWLLNIDYIKQNSEGQNTIRFLNACLFFNPNEIQDDLINVGQPPISDEQFRNFVGTSLGKYQIFKLLTDFSLFKQCSSRCLQVHRLVLDVIKESLSPREQQESFLDAVRLLHYSLSKSDSFNEPSSGVAFRGSNFIDCNNPSLFYMWRTLCIHAGEIEKNLNNLLLDESSMQSSVLLPETAQVVYHHALYLSAFCRHEEAMQAMNFAVKILEWLPEEENERLSTKPAPLNYLFPQAVPLPENIRRHIQYSKAPASHNVEEYVNSSVQVEEVECIDKLREKGNKLFGESRFEEAVEVYSSVINRNEKQKSLDPRFFSNRASAYLRLQLYEKALEDAKAYISRSPKCWKGYARKALALHGLNDKLGAELAASQTYNFNRDVFSKYPPFKEFAYLEKCVSFCYSGTDLLHALNTMPPGKRVIFLYPGVYEITQSIRFYNCILLGCEKDTRIRVCYKNDSNIVSLKCSLANLSFEFDRGACLKTACTVIYNCGFSSRNSICAALQVSGETKVENCDFRNCSAGGLLCADTDSFDGVASVENCTFSNNGKAGLEVCKGGTLLAKNVNSYNNRQGLLIGPQAKKCVLTDSQINCNTYDGITAYECENDPPNYRIELRNNFVFHNDHFGIGVRNSSALIAENRVFENGFWGIWLQSNSFCHISGNEVSHNRVGGIRIGKRPCGSPPSVLDDNKINDNCGPGLIQCINYLDVNTFVDKQPVFPVQWANPFRSSVPVLPPALEDTLVSAQCNGNTELKYTLTQPSMNKFCSFCRRKKVTLVKCTQCYVAEYCGQDCQEKHRKKHKKVCESILEKSSVLLTSTKKVRGPLRSWLQLGLVLVLVLWLLGWLGLWLGLGLELLLGSWLGFVCAKEHRYDLEGACPKHSKPPEYGKRFIVKVQQSYGFFDVDSMSLCICDQSLTIYDIFQSPHVNNLIRDLGAISERQFIGKKLFMWAAYTENRVGWKKLFMWVKGHEVRVFINEFPSYQQW